MLEIKILLQSGLNGVGLRQSFTGFEIRDFRTE
jgi:hypothetical protein